LKALHKGSLEKNEQECSKKSRAQKTEPRFAPSLFLTRYSFVVVIIRHDGELLLDTFVIERFTGDPDEHLVG
jgi:hypothetical protein